MPKNRLFRNGRTETLRKEVISVFSKKENDTFAIESVIVGYKPCER